ncbi:hypothetical protein QQS21_002061 [Conoideocrella luteorostrata]|uniref:Delta(24)-sterol reductase n=1 Tax=Conoideocrella luteorostrata TaxID=1105319 RepID=A0AAJ0G1H6_9HYPO|nr:hypothetical protein QQS21_002061 [Conoideocrella luteorostrata]
MEHHAHVVCNIAATIKSCFEKQEPFRIFHGSSNSTRPRHQAGTKVVDISGLSNVVSVDAKARVALVEPNVPMDRLVEVSLNHGLVPPVVMEFPGITTGGGFSGTSGESSSFRHGFFNDNINSVEMILGNGEVVVASDTEREDLFHAAAGAAGTLGVITLLEVRLVKAKQFVQTTYQRVGSVSEALSLLEIEAKNEQNHYVDGILFNDIHGVIITGRLVDEKPADQHVQTFSRAADPWYYMYVQDITAQAKPSLPHSDYIPLAEYLFRYDRAAFWVGREGYTYFKYIPFNRFFRWLLDDFSHTRTLYHALHAGGISSRFLVQDVALPQETAEEFIKFASTDLGIWPLWLCPLRETRTPTFHPMTHEKRGLAVGEGTSQRMVSIGVWGWGPRLWRDFVRANRALERKLYDLNGRKWLYAHCYYTEEEFWSIYDQQWYESLREKYHANTLPTVFDKVTINLEAQLRERNTWGASVTDLWPIGGVYGMWRAFTSGDWRLHRGAMWQWKGGATPATTVGRDERDICI